MGKEPNAHNDLIEEIRHSGNWDEVIISSSEYTTLAYIIATHCEFRVIDMSTLKKMFG